VKCTDCGIKMGGETHVITRTTNFDPYAEVWVQGNPTIEATLDVTASVSLEFSHSVEKTISEMSCRKCHTAQLGPLPIRFGIAAELKAVAQLEFDAEFRVNYNRKATAFSNIKAHYVGSRQFSHHVTRPEPIVTSLNGGEPEPPSLELDVNAKVEFVLKPTIHIGVFPTAGFLSAEAAIIVKPEIKLEAVGAIRISTTGENLLDAIPTESGCDATTTTEVGSDVELCCKPEGSSGLPSCPYRDVCAAEHNMQVDLSLVYTLYVGFHLLATVDFGSWGQEYDFTKWFYQGAAHYTQEPTIEYNTHIASYCWDFNA